ncbi:MAG: choice-of-anchor L domain-containing protein [Bacteroidia bacterium]
MRKSFIRFFALLLFVFQSISSIAQLNITIAPAQNLVEDVLVGSGVSVSNVTTVGDIEQVGTFNGGNSVNLGIENGVVMTAGNLQAQLDINGPDYIGAPADAGTVSSSIDNGVEDDPDLNAILGSFGVPQATNNVSVIEFDFVPSGDSLAFNYVFASEEFDGFVCSNFFDVFGFFISGPGFNGPFTNSAVNIALVPGTTLPVSMNTINDGISDGGSACPPGGLNNTAYYVDNSASQNFAPFGFTRILTAQANVTCGETYHIKLIIANGSDNAYDSWVFLQAESFSSNIPNFQIANLLPDSSVVEGCTTGNLIFTRDQTDLELVVPMLYGGTAIAGEDYEPLPDTITFAAGQDSLSISLIPFLDNFDEGYESIILTFRLVNDCGDTLTLTETVFIRDQYELIITTPDPLLNCPDANLSIGALVEGGYPPYQFEWEFNNLTTPTINVAVSQTDTFNVLITDSLDCIFAQYNEQVIVRLNYDSLTTESFTELICDGDTISISPAFALGRQPYSFAWDGIVSDETIEVFPTDTSEYIFTVTDDCGIESSDTVTVFVPQYDELIVTASDTTICQNGTATLQVLVEGGEGNYAYVWSGPPSILPTNDSMATVTPGGNTAYSIVVTDGCGVTATDILTVMLQNCQLQPGDAFSPNGDGFNDFFEVANIQFYPNNTVWIYNRWGKKVLEESAYMNTWGAGSDVTAGTYFYVIDPGDGTGFLKGYVTIFKD